MTVVPMKPEAVRASFAPIKGIVEELEKLLEQAKSGKLQACAWAVVFEADAKPDGEVAHGWAHGPYTSFALTAAIERLSFRWKRHEYESTQ